MRDRALSVSGGQVSFPLSSYTFLVNPSPEYIYEELKKKSIERHRFFFGRHLFVIKNSDFKSFEKHFVEVPDILNNLTNYRTRHAFKHIHAVKSDSLVQFHYDFGNIGSAFFMAVPHFFIDVCPFFAYWLVTLENPYTIGLEPDRS